MSIIAKIHVEHDQLALVPTLKRLDDVAIRVITQGNTAPASTVFPFLFEYDDRGALEAALEADATVATYELVDRTEGTSIYYIEHTPETKLISPVVTDANGVLLHTETSGGGWLVRLMLPSRDGLSAVWDYAERNDVSLDIIEIYSNREVGTQPSYGLTAEQETALKVAYERGYLDEPHDVSLRELAEEMGLSSTAMSGRIHRGMRNLVAATIVDEDG